MWHLWVVVMEDEGMKVMTVPPLLILLLLRCQSGIFASRAYQRRMRGGE
jgi:hypothetical protein